MTGDSQRRAAALLEVLGVYLAGPVAMYGLRRWIGLSLTNPLNNLTVNVSSADLVTASGQLFTLLVFGNAGYFILAGPLNWWYRRRGPAGYGLTKAGHDWTMLILAGLGTACFFEWPAVSVGLLNLIHPGPTVPWREALFAMSWRRWQFWLFSGVLSWAGAPFFEELFYRGYCQRRLAEDWGDGPAVFGAACLFTFSHGQYLRLDAYNLGMIIGLLLSAIGFGLVFAWTRSLIPSMIAHAVFDIPLTPIGQGLLLAGLIIGVIVVRRRAVFTIKQIVSSDSTTACIALGILAAAYAVLASLFETPIYLLSIGILALAVFFEVRDRRANCAENYVSVSS